MSQAAPANETRKLSLVWSLVGSWLVGLMEALSALRAAAAMSLVTILALWLPPQIGELYRVLMQKGSGTDLPALQYQWVAAVLALVLLSFVLWRIARELAHVASSQPDLHRTPAVEFFLDWSPRIFAAAPFIGAILGLWKSLPPQRIIKLPDEVSAELQGILDRLDKIEGDTIIAMALAVVLAVLVLLAITLFERRVVHAGAGRESTDTRRLFFVDFWFLFAIAGAALIAAFIWLPTRLTHYFGAIPIFALWVVISTVLLAAGTRLHDLHRLPVVTIAVIAVVVFEIFGLSDNHQFRRGEDKVLPRPDVGNAFVEWLAARADAKAYRDKGKDYPVYLVAAEGGGMYAAYHTAKVLSRMQDLCERFAPHVCAVSSVPGGSLGAA